MSIVTLYADGSCHGNPGAGGYAAIVLQNGITREVHGGDYFTTNNRMELTAVIEGLRLLSAPSTVVIKTDSRYVADQINRKNLRAYVTTPGRRNADLWEKVLQLSVLHKLSAVWVRGHAGDKFNEKCDRIANNEAFKIEREKDLRETVFSEMLLDPDVPPETVARRRNMSVHTVRKYQDLFRKHQGGESIAPKR